MLKQPDASCMEADWPTDSYRRTLSSGLPNPWYRYIHLRHSTREWLNSDATPHSKFIDQIGKSKVPSTVPYELFQLAEAPPPVGKRFSYSGMYGKAFGFPNHTWDIDKDLMHLPRNSFISAQDAFYSHVLMTIVTQLRNLITQLQRDLPYIKKRIKNDRSGAGHCSVLIMAGTDMKASHPRIWPLLKELNALGIITRMYVEANDVDSDFVQTIPMGLNGMYLVKNGLHNVASAIEKARTERKSKLVLAAFGAMWNASTHREEVQQFVETNDWIDHMRTPFDRYWSTLMQYSFLIAPPGSGIQSPKFAEAWLVRVIPVVVKMRAFIDLRDLGFPLVLVDAWQHLTRNVLVRHLDSRKTGDIDWERVEYMLTTDGWSDTFLCNCSQYPEDKTTETNVTGAWYYDWSC